MKKKLSKFVALIMIAAFILMPAAAFADTEKDTAGNLYISGATESVSGGKFFGGFGAGRDISVAGSKANDTLCLAGQNISLKGSEIGGSFFVAGQNISVKNTKTSGNIAAAGYSVSIDKKSSARSVKACGNTVDFGGFAKAAYLYGEKVVFSGKIDGDVMIYAQEAIIDENAKITGKLTVKAAKEPEISDKTSVGNYEFVKIKRESFEIKKPENPFNGVRSCIYAAVAMTLIALTMCWLAPGTLNGSGELVRRKPGVMLGSGAIVLAALPFAFIILCITVIGIPLAFVIGMGAAAAALISVAFTGASLGRAFIPWRNSVPATLTGAAGLVIAAHIPYLGILVHIGALIYIFGYILQYMWGKRARKVATVTEEITESEV